MSTQTETFQEIYESEDAEFEVPSLVETVGVELEGAAGESGDEPGGSGGVVAGDLSTDPGETLYIRFIGGGDRGGDPAGSGGDSSDVRQGGDTLEDRVAAAGGGGGGAGTDGASIYESGAGGDGGGGVGESGDDASVQDGDRYGDGGDGGSQESGGSGGDSDDTPGGDGFLGFGGDGVEGGVGRAYSGGGGGGYYGGGAGGASSASGGSDDWAAAGGGGGGSNYSGDLETVGANEQGTSTRSYEDGGLVKIEFEVTVDPATNVEAVDERADEVDLAWTVNDSGADGQRIYRATSPDVDVDVLDPIADLDGGDESYTDTGLDHGTDYYYQIETYVEVDGEDDVTAVSDDRSAQTLLPDVTDFELDASVRDELGVEAIETEPTLNTGRYRMRWKRSVDDEYDDEIEIPYDADSLEYVISSVLDGEQYDVAVRSETDDVTGDWLDASEITKLVPVDDLTLDPADADVRNYATGLEVAWTMVSDFDGAVEVYRYETVDEPDDLDELGTLIATLETDAEEYTADADAHHPGRDYVYTIRCTTDWIHADADEVFITSRAGLQASLYAEIDDPRREDPIELDPPKAIRNAQIRHSATSDVSIATVDMGPALRSLARLNPDYDLRVELTEADGAFVRDDRIIKGVVGEIETQGQSDEAVLKCKGRGWFLERESPESPVTFSNIRVWEAARAYGEDHLEGWEVDVTPDPGTTIAENEVGQDPSSHEEWEDLLEDATDPTDPLLIDDGELKQSRCSWVFDDPGPFGDATASAVADDDYSDGIGREFEDAGDYVESEPFDVTHRLEADDIGIAVRVDTSLASDGQNATVELQLIDADTDEEEHSLVIYEGNDGTGALWRGFGDDDIPVGLIGGPDEWGGGDLNPGEYYVRLECTDPPAGDGDPTIVDISAIFDGRFSYDWDNSVHEDGGYLDGPEPHPTVSFEMPLVDRETNIDAARIESVWNDTGGEQSIALSNDDGGNWIEASNTTSLEADFASEELFGSQLRARFTFSGYPFDDDPQDQTPRYRYEPQAVDSYELRFDQSSVAVANELVLSDSHKQNLNTLCDRGRMNWVVDHTADGKVLEVFPIGTEAPDADRVQWPTLDWSRTDGSWNHANRVVARGARKPEEERENEDDIRYEAVVQDDEDIQERIDMGAPEEKAVVTETLLDPEWDSHEEVQQQAFNALEELVEAQQPSGSFDVVPTFIKPGYAYPIEEWEDENGDAPTKQLEQATVSQEHSSASGQLQFEAPQNWVRAVDPIGKDVGGLKRLF